MAKDPLVYEPPARGNRLQLQQSELWVGLAGAEAAIWAGVELREGLLYSAVAITGMLVSWSVLFRWFHRNWSDLLGVRCE